ncbi:MAG TPA: carbonic anhydrase [Stenomitos sp.]
MKTNRWLPFLCAWALLGLPAVADEQRPTGDEAIQRLMDGNERHFAKKFIHPDQWEVQRAEVAKVQHPFAIVLGCSDSRVPPEIIFDQGLGDLFVIRVAGNIVDPAVLGSIEYAAEHLESPLVMVLGHERCGAVAASVKGGEAPGHLQALVTPIKPAVQLARKQKGDLLDNAVRANIRLVVDQVRTSQPTLAHLVHEGRLKVVGARYDLDTGRVEVLEPVKGR